MVKKIVFLATAIFSFISIEIMAADSIGTVIAAQGKVYATNEEGVKRLLQRRSEFYLQEFITTQENSMAQLKLKDDTIISLKPSTKYSVSEFNLDAKNPKNNRYVGKLVEGVLISFSGQGENSTHNNHVLKTPLISIAIRGTLYESGFKIKNYKTNRVVNKTLGIGWVSVEDGAVDIVSGGGVRWCDLVSKEADNNANFAISSGKLDKNGQFKVGARSEVSIVCTSNVMMRKLVATATTASGGSTEIIAKSDNGTEKIVVVPVTQNLNAQQSTAQIINNAVTPQSPLTPPQNPVINPEPLPIPPATPGRPVGPPAG